jgi:hypothetical protein
MVKIWRRRGRKQSTCGAGFTRPGSGVCERPSGAIYRSIVGDGSVGDGGGRIGRRPGNRERECSVGEKLLMVEK